ncbi:Hydroxymethylpyrimidine kinase [Saliniradius amylolyticus]|uniref:Thiamine-phosphate synthase n=1 Tax=Saliniradius amylolyticus TaxID=2183582 RepID=A0A2S2E654_9ALTE|nr:thiamine phosphate synthase [Saliniradius amylolyticus]AWL12720.1 Hydroxymethylpyrimidine kinase [Saliniradius amylolyticus]
MRRPKVLTIAGSDTSAGAGIQADLMTLADFNAEGKTVVTALTAQTPNAVFAVEPVGNRILQEQLSAVKHIALRGIKIGLIVAPAQVAIIANFIRQLRQKTAAELWVVLDPVLNASAGSQLQLPGTLEAIQSQLLPLVDVITPNLDEAEVLTGLRPTAPNDRVQAAMQIQRMGPGSVVIKGGHDTAGHCLDYGLCGQNHYWLQSPRQAVSNSHGTGCRFSSAIAALLARDYPLKDALTLAKAYINHSLALAKDSPEANLPHPGWPENIELFPRALPNALQNPEPLELPPGPGFAPCKTKPLGLYPVVDSVDWITRLIPLAVKTLQIRLKHAGPDELRQQLTEAIALCRENEVQLFINDHWQLAIELDAYGVHLGQEDLLKADLSAIARAGLRLGVSTHGEYEMMLAHSLKPSYMAFGAIFDTKTKDMSGQLQGTERLGRYVRLIKNCPQVAIGGINADNLDSVLATGIESVAVVSAITEAEDVRARVKVFQSRLEGLTC